MDIRFWCPDPDAAARAVLRGCPQDAQRSISIANDLCRHRFLFRDHWEMERTSVPVQFGPRACDIDWAHIPAGDPEWLYALNRHTCFVNLGKAWRYTGEPRYADAYAALTDDWIARVPLTEASRRDTWRSLEAGLRCETWLRALALFRNSAVLTPDRRSRIHACLAVHGEYLAAASDDFHKLSNWGVLQDHGLYLLGLYLDRADWRALAVRRLDENLHHSVMRDGTHWEQSPLYHCEVLHCALDTVLAARRCGQALPDRLTTNTLALCRALAKWLKPDGRLICQSDSDDTDARDLLVEGALLFRDPLLRAAAGGALFEETLWDFGPGVQAEYDALPCDAPWPTSTLLPDSGNVMLHGAQGAFVHMHCGCLGSGHGHADLLHLDAAIAGEDVLLDSGRYTYVNTPLRRRLKLPAAHNTLRLDGLDFSTCVDSWGYATLATPLKGETTFTPAADYASGLHLGYLEQGVVTARKLIFLKRQGVLLIFDQFFGKGSHLYEQNFHFGEGSAMRNGQTLHWTGRAASADLHCLGSGLELTLDRHPYARNYNDLRQGDGLTVRRHGQDFGWFVTVLSMNPGKARPLAAELLPVKKLRQGGELLPAQAQAVRVVKDGAEAVVLVCHAEVISEVDLLAAGGCAGYGKALVFTPDHPGGLCLAW